MKWPYSFIIKLVLKTRISIKYKGAISIGYRDILCICKNAVKLKIRKKPLNSKFHRKLILMHKRIMGFSKDHPKYNYIDALVNNGILKWLSEIKSY